MSDFVHLHVHSEYSLLDGLAKISDLIDKAKEQDMDSLALTDHGAMYGSFKFYKEAKKASIKPIIGFEAYQAKKSRFDRKKEGHDRSHLTLLAKDENGYKNLMKLTTIAHLEGFYYKPRIDMEVLEKYSAGLVCLSGCMQGIVPSLLGENKEKEAYAWAERFANLFKNDYYIELQKHPKIIGLNSINKKLLKLSDEIGIPVVATNDVHYADASDAYAQEILLCIQTQRTILEKNRPLSMINSPDFYFRSASEMKGLFLEREDAIENTVKIARKCNLTIDTGKWVLPNFPTPKGMTPEQYLKRLTQERLPARFAKTDKEIRARIGYELEVICKKGYATYFLIVADFVNWAKDNGITVGPGRGSVAGSLVAYVLCITDINPLLHNIPFERFLNWQRPSPPDIDLDFADDRRDEVIQYVTDSYGKNKVAQIITFGTMEARAAIRDAGRALGMPYSVPDRIAKMIPHGAQGFTMTLDTAKKLSPELSYAYNNEEDTKRLIDLAKKLEGVSRHASTHAAGVVISDKELTEYVPLQRESRAGKIVTQYDMYSLDLNAVSDGIAVGLLKMDFLGLRNLSILEKAIRYVKKNYGKTIVLSEIPLDDKKTYDLVSRGDTIGVFQLESAGMRRLGRKLKPNRFSDIAAMVALYRPGPMALIDDFVKNKNNPDNIHYPHKDLKKILESTYGVAVYQEQCMQIANIIAGYSMSEADGLRLAMGKKKKEIMQKEKEKFIKGSIKNGYTMKVAERLFSFIEKFVGYGFNIPHSVSYGMIAYWTAYMKAQYPIEFMTALLTAEVKSTSGPAREEKLKRGIEECRRMNIPIRPPDINKSGVEFTIVDKKIILFGLNAVKNIGTAAIDAILSARKNGEFTSFSNFCERVDLRKVNKKTLESLIKIGALDVFGKRSSMLMALPDIMQWAQKKKKEIMQNQTSMFGTLIEEKQPSLPKIEEFSKKELLAFEKQLLGFYLSEHPLSSKLKNLKTPPSHTILELNDGETSKSVRIAGIVSRIKKVTTKRGNNEMLFVTIEDLTGSIEGVVFPTVYQKTKKLWVQDSGVLVSGTIDRRDNRLHLLIERVYPLDL